MTRPRRSLLTLVLLAALVLPAAGCTSRTTANPDPTEATTSVTSVAPSPTPPPSPTPTYAVPTEPARPAAMDTVDVAGAIATATYFMELYPYVFATGDLAALQEISHPECIYCKSVRDDATTYYAAGDRMEGLATRFLSAAGSELDPGVAFGVDAQVEQEGFTVRDSAGNVISVDDNTVVISMTFSIWREGDRWLVREAQTNDE